MIKTTLIYGIDCDANSDLFDNYGIFKVITEGFELITGQSPIRAVEAIQHAAKISGKAMNDYCTITGIENTLRGIACYVDSKFDRDYQCITDVEDFLLREEIIAVDNVSVVIEKIDKGEGSLDNILIGVPYETKLRASDVVLLGTFNDIVKDLEMLFRDNVTSKDILDRACVYSITREYNEYGAVVGSKFTKLEIK